MEANGRRLNCYGAGKQFVPGPLGSPLSLLFRSLHEMLNVLFISICIRKVGISSAEQIDNPFHITTEHWEQYVLRHGNFRFYKRNVVRVFHMANGSVCRSSNIKCTIK